MIHPQLDFDFGMNQFIPPEMRFQRASGATNIVGNRLGVPVAQNVARFAEDGILIEPMCTNYVCGDINTIAVGTVNPAGYSGAAGATTVSNDVYALFGDRVLKHIYPGAGDSNVSCQVVGNIPALATISAVLWVWIPAAAVPTDLTLTLEDASSPISTYVSGVDWAIRDQWQRLVTSIKLAAGRASTSMVFRTKAITPIYTCGWNLITGNSVGTYIIPDAKNPTTRQNDSLVFVEIPNFSPIEGCIYLEFTCGKTDLEDWRRVFEANDNDHRWMIVIGLDLQGKIYTHIRYRDKFLMDLNPVAITNGVIRYVLRWNDGSAQIACNGVVFPIDTNVVMPTIRQMALGGSPNGVTGSTLNGVIHRFTLFGHAVSEADILQLSTSGIENYSTGKLGSAQLAANTVTFLYMNETDNPVTANLRVVDPFGIDAEWTVWISAGRAPATRDLITRGLRSLVEETALVIGAGESVFLMSTESGSVARLHGL